MFLDIITTIYIPAIICIPLHANHNARLLPNTRWHIYYYAYAFTSCVHYDFISTFLKREQFRQGCGYINS